MNYGVIYLNQGSKCLVRCLVSIRSLRKVYRGKITLFQVGESPQWFCSLIEKYNVDIVYLCNDGMHPLVRKTTLWRYTPYDNTFFIDADTLILKPIDEVFGYIQDHEFISYNFANWRSDGNIVSRRIRGFSKIVSDDDIKLAIKYGKTVNVGVFGFKRGAEFLPHWESLTRQGFENNCSNIPDEIACQILLPKYKSFLLPPTWGVSVKFATDEEIKNGIIIHYHGRKHCLPKYKLCRLWENEYLELVKENENIPELKQSHGDRRLNSFQVNIFSKKNSDITYVSAVNDKYFDRFKSNYIRWMNVNGIKDCPFVIFARSNILNRLDFLNSNTKLIIWDYGIKEGYSERESMISSFVLGIPDNISTKYFVKIDADVSPKVNEFEWDKKYLDYDLVAHKWGYTKSKGAWNGEHFLNTLDNWWGERSRIIDKFPSNIHCNDRYYHKRIASFVCLHRTEFVKHCAELAGNRLPIPSHDTFLWFVAAVEGKRIKRINLKKYFEV